MLIETQKELKALAAGLRREIRSQLGLEALSHNQCLELVAKAFGAGSYAQLAAKLPPGKDRRNSADEPRRLSNKGQLDLAQDGIVLDGLTFKALQGRVEDIPGCVAYSSSGQRTREGLVPHYEGGTEVNWDGQCPRTDERGRAWWLRADGEMVCEDALVVVPETWQGPDDDGLTVRAALVQTYLLELRRRGQASALTARQLRLGGLEDRLLEDVAQTLGFALHARELDELCLRLEQAAGGS